ncbi:hypothetical protein METBIDRAFT_10625 [Metschnikowia bicuspidata var. bicuspidata NRRL YB-4993]|uniref:Zinc finger C3HC4 RING-type domain-containing protein n=1 Tax=Metschnikowia bicuspidata var. bicuspidata NRRL YB-4993 TaxID=869754 RepID=A0A1A0HKE3_9ASCO|nr:hypothetical protein METBIDRAFT_10625 [Metschnikowia bicuspidata var. bicuspidata NRRL YB-4993]OBA24490.1 hypothetical protein METBIDRAFT_10625 [Metschnikowia bicuspidata var. bicuspidata NRRL YB-4993]
MSERAQTKSPTPQVVEVESEDDLGSPVFPSSNYDVLRQNNVIEVTSDASGDEDVEIVAENSTHSNNDDVEITGHTTADPPMYEIEFPGGPPSRPRSIEPTLSRPTVGARSLDTPFSRNVRRRPNPRQNRNLYQARFYPRVQNPLWLSYDDIPAFLAEHSPQTRLFFQGQGDGDISSAIMDRISREEENSLDRKMESENRHNRKVLEKKKGVACDELDGYTNDIAPDDNVMCELCGIVLGEGIPTDFEPDLKYDENLEVHASSSQVMAPWYCIRQCFSTDRELSKRVFAAKCGHVFCGRCIKNIGNRPPSKRGKNSNHMTTLNPQISAPRKCPAEECGVAFNKSKKTFLEIFL